MKEGKVDKKTEMVSMQFANNSLLPMLYGDDDKHLAKLEKSFGIVATSRGNALALTGDAHSVQISRDILQELYHKLETGAELSSAQVDAAIRMAQPPKSGSTKSGGGKSHRAPIASDMAIKTQKKTVQPYSLMQAEYIEALANFDLVFALGPAGTGKTYLAVAQRRVAVHLSQNRVRAPDPGRARRSRPAKSSAFCPAT